MADTILLIDDSADYRRILTMRLKSFLPSATIHTAETVQSALDILRSENGTSFDLVVLDHHLPDGTGLTLLTEPALQNQAILAVSSDDDPQIPGESMRAGATYFLSKSRISEPLFKSIVLGIIDRNKSVRELAELKRKETVMETVKTLIGTLRHEINNPLGAVLGATYILKGAQSNSPDVAEAVRLVEESGKRIKHVLDEISKAVSLDEVMKAKHKVFQIPGDTPWED
jgi:CheY-like chemotaxis protein